jgi:hypothetical protein
MHLTQITHPLSTQFRSPKWQKEFPEPSLKP